ncbi:MAG: polysaccharide biosynthesis protein [Alphaproteobacteria bacterium]|nr:polysaccharide biosynthesis protein [Alphaproteobacteria bacterium]
MIEHRSRPPFSYRAALVALHDLIMAAVSFELSVWFRYLTYGVPQEFGFLWEGTLIFTAVAAVAFWVFGLYRGIWYYASLSDLTAITKAVTAATLVFLPILFAVNRIGVLPRSALVINWVLLVLLLAAPRFLYRLFKDGNFSSVLERVDDPRVPVLLAGAGDEADTFIREMGRSRQAPYRVVGLLDRDTTRVGRNIRGIGVLGTYADLDRVVGALRTRYLAPQRVILASDRIDGATVQRLLQQATALGMTLARLPRLTELRHHESVGASALAVRPIEIEDLLGRTQRVLDRTPVARFVIGRRVLITGAGGTIGSELVRQIAALGPAKLALVDNSEFNLYRIDLELAEQYAAVTRVAIMADVRDSKRLDSVFAAERPEIVFHAAAMKHVPLAETNPCEAVLTNVGGTLETARAAHACGALAFVLISTDKAVNPSSVMGSTKRIAEAICQALENKDSNNATRFITVRFGNVLGSTGSVVPLFQRQLARGGPLTVTHRDATRYFMTTREAVELVLQAAASEEHANFGKIFVLDMGDPVAIADLARQMIRLAGLAPDKDVRIEYTGLRPGEKVVEEIFHSGEPLTPTKTDGLLLASPRVTDGELLLSQVERLLLMAARGDAAAVLSLISTVVPEYRAAGPEPARGTVPIA